MKRLSSIFLLALFFLASSRPAQAETFIISYLDADSVIVDGRTCRVDSSFNLTSKTRIDWGKASLLEAYSTATGLMRTFACPKEEKDLKWTERLYRKTIGAFADFYVRDNAGSTRAFTDYDLSTYLSSTFYLRDTIFVRVDDVDIITQNIESLDSKQSPQNIDPQEKLQNTNLQEKLPQYLISFTLADTLITRVIPRRGDLLLITRSLFDSTEQSEHPEHRSTSPTIVATVSEHQAAPRTVVATVSEHQAEPRTVVATVSKQIGGTETTLATPVFILLH